MMVVVEKRFPVVSIAVNDSSIVFCAESPLLRRYIHLLSMLLVYYSSIMTMIGFFLLAWVTGPSSIKHGSYPKEDLQELAICHENLPLAAKHGDHHC